MKIFRKFRQDIDEAKSHLGKLVEDDDDAAEHLAKHDEYIPHVSKLKFSPVDHETWSTIKDEGLHHEQNLPNRAHWHMAHLPISKSHHDGLKKFDDDTVNHFNRFDIALKHRHKGKLVDLIDYDKGHVKIVKPHDYDHTKMNEDAPTNNAGGGNIAGIGVGPNGEPGVHHLHQRKTGKLKLMNGPAVDPRIFSNKIFSRRPV